jgi:hypothetical protein
MSRLRFSASRSPRRSVRDAGNQLLVPYGRTSSRESASKHNRSGWQRSIRLRCTGLFCVCVGAFMSVLSSSSISEPTKSVRHGRRAPDISDGDVLTDIAKLVLWQRNTAAHLAAAVEKHGGQCSVRQAERYLGGHEWSGDAVAAVMQEILVRRSMRNVRVVARR